MTVRPPRALLVLVAIAALGACSMASAKPAGRGEARPVVLLVHGRGKIGEDSAALRREWLHALDAGTSALAGGPVLRDGDVRLVWYADVLAGGEGAGCTPRARVAGGDAGEDEGLGLRLIAGIAGALLDAAEPAAGDASDGARELRNFAGDLHFFGSPRTRCAAEQRVGDALARAQREGRPVILVAYSMGAIVSWAHLEERVAGGVDRDTLPRIARLVTIGSPVGSPDVRSLVLGRARPLTLPARVGSWVNVIDADDPLAAPLRAARDAHGLTDVRRVRSDGDTPHDLDGYLRDPATARAVLEGWCGAIGGGARECRALATPRAGDAAARAR